MADGVEQMAFASQGAVAVAGNTLFYSPDGTTFVPAAQGPSADRAVGQGDCADLSSHPSFPVQRVLATDSGFVSFAVGHFSDRDDFRCGPLLWTSVDGNIWDVVSGDSPFGDAAVIGEVAERNGRFIATGSTPDSEAALWISDDGLTWAMQALELEAIDGLAAGGLGWVMTGTSHGYAEPTIYFSSDGVTWGGPYPLPPALGAGYLPVQLTVGPDFVMNIDAPALGRLQD